MSTADMAQRICRMLGVAQRCLEAEMKRLILRGLSIGLVLAAASVFVCACGDDAPQGPGFASDEDPASGDKPSGDDGDHEGDSDEDDEGEPGSADGGCQTFESSFAAIQEVIFERHGCTAGAC